MAPLIAEIFSQGEEVVSGQVVDSNAAWLSQQLTELGFDVRRHNAVGDNLAELAGLMAEIAERADCCLCTGGLGPTCDDLTAEAAARVTGQDLTFDPEALRQIEDCFRRRQRPMPAANRKQAYFPAQSVRIDNPIGTAPGFALRIKRCWFVFLPGVPAEMKAMFPEVGRQLLARFSLQPARWLVLRSVGIGESAIQERLQNFALPDGVQLGFRAAADEVQTKLRFPPDFALAEAAAYARQAAELIGDCVFALDGLDDGQGGDLLSVIERGLNRAKLQLAVLETASHGLLAAKCQGREWLVAAMTAKDAEQAGRQLDVTAEDGELPALAESLALALQQRQQTPLALVQLFAGSAQDVGRNDKSVVLYNCLLTRTGALHKQHILGGHGTQNQAAMLSLDLIRRYLQQPCL